ncbi:scoloptoxin SSD14-like isoform X2 [Planococcus citri]|uniref:scoloptoxin SSD14-like isoform X2 n=1 Tax=Planococcus citri TaxID=170843 RepID=UPI0031F972B9
MLIANKLSCKIALVAAMSAILIVILVFVFLRWPHDRLSTANSTEVPTPTGPIPLSILGNYSRAAAVSNAPPCAEIAKDILLKGGKAVDATIALMLCDGVTMPQSMGIGGGFFMTIYDKSSRKAYTINAREHAPAASTPDMYKHNPEAAKRGGLSIGVPGEIRGYWLAYNKFGGGLPWKDLFEPTIKLCEQGIPISKKLATVMIQFEEMIKTDREFSLIFTNKSTGALLEHGETYKNLKLAQTFRTIAEQGGDVFYEGPMAKTMVQEIQGSGGIITEEDLKNYQPRLEDPLKATIFDNMTIHTLHAPSSGPILAYILRLVDGLVPANNELLNTQRITEAMKFAYGARSRLGDPHFVNINRTMNMITSEEYIKKIRNSIDDTKTWNDPAHYGGDFVEAHNQGTANVAVVSENGDAVAATSTINYYFGSTIISPSTGVIFNDQMDDFSSPNLTNMYGVEPSKANFIAPGKIPVSSMNPSIITDKNGDVRLVIGAAGGTKITSATAIATIRTLVLQEDIRKAVDSVLFHHQLLPMEWYYYQRMPKDIVEGMKKIGHEVKLMAATSFAAITAIERSDSQLHACSDYKRPGQVAGY